MDATTHDSSQWLRNPLQERQHRLRPSRDLTLYPFFGKRRSVHLSRTHLTIGASTDCDVVLQDPFVSPRHAELRLVDGVYVVRDLASRNGVYLNGVRVSSAPLPSRGTLRLGRSRVTWTDEEEASAGEIGDGWLVADPSMRALLQSLRRAAASPLPVLLLGETGTGKDMLARLLHEWGRDSRGPYVAVNGALTGGPLAESELFGHRKGAFTGAESSRLGALRSADGGTLFLDEVADIPSATQVKLLRSLETGEVKALGSDVLERTDFRLVCATSRDLEARMQRGEFRQDLYYRLAGFVVHVPPLRERPLDVLAIGRHIAGERGLELDGESESRLLSARWPGNVRELRVAVERACLAARAAGFDRILPEHLGELDSTARAVHVPEAGARPPTLLECERRVVQAALERNGWSRSAAARELGIARSSLHGKMRKFGLRDAISPIPRRDSG